ncbi:polysaccharide biosynthesis C-terminal domain-containing protein [Gillisia sp. Q332]|uniref:oligosaccharide flippase family protein n=1 Tax=Gillisia xinjiangensis TaxID=3384765 RepID=UPI00391CEDE9
MNFIKDFISVGLSRGGVIIFSLAQSIIIARWLGPELNGVIAALLVFPSLFMSLGSLGVSQSTAYFIGKGKFTEREIKTAVSQIWVFTSILSIIICFMLIRYFSNSGENLTLVFLALAPIPFALFNTYNSGIFLGKNEIQKYNKINWLPPLFILAGTILLVIVIDFSITGAMGAMVIGPAIMSFLMLFKNKFINAFSTQIDLKVIKALLSLGGVYAIALIIINLNYKLDVILIDKLSTSYQTGIYSKGAGFIQYLWQIPMLLSTIVFARSVTSKNSYNFSVKVCQLLRVSISLIGLASIILAFIAPFVITLLYGSAFIDSASVLLYLIPGVLLLTVFKVLNMDLAGRGKPWISLKAMAPALLVNIICNFLWIPKFGANGAALASTISYSVAAILFVIIYSREVSMPIREIFNYKKSDFKFIEIMFHNVIIKLKN